MQPLRLARRALLTLVAVTLGAAQLPAQEPATNIPLRDWYRRAPPAVAVRVIPSASIQFTGRDLAGDAEAYRTALAGHTYRGRVLSVGYLGERLDTYYARVRADFRVGRTADVARTPTDPTDDVLVERGRWDGHSLFVAHMAEIRDSRFFVYFAYGYTFGTLSVDETTPTGRRRTTLREFTHFRVQIEPGVELYTDAGTGFSVAAGYPVMAPLLLQKGFGAVVRGAGLWVAATLPWGND